MMLNLHSNLLTALISAITTVATCQGNVFESVAGRSAACPPARDQGAVNWHGHAKRLDVHAGRGRVHIRTASDGDIEVRAVAQRGADTAPFVLLALQRGQKVTVCVAPAGSSDETDGASCPSDVRDWPGHLVPAVDLEVSVPEGVSVHAAGVTT